MTTSNPATKRDLPAGEPTTFSPPRKGSKSDESMDENAAVDKKEEDDGMQAFTPPVTGRAYRETRASSLRKKLDQTLEDTATTTTMTYETEIQKKQKIDHQKNINKADKEKKRKEKEQKKKIRDAKKATKKATPNQNETEGPSTNNEEDKIAKADRNDPADAESEGNQEGGEQNESNTAENDKEQTSNEEEELREDDNNEEKANDDKEEAGSGNDGNRGEENGTDDEEDTITETAEDDKNGGDGDEEMEGTHSDNDGKAKDTEQEDLQTNTNPRQGAEIQQEGESEESEDEDSSIETVEEPPKRLSVEEMSFFILHERSRGITSPGKMPPNTDNAVESYESIRLFVCTEISDFIGRAAFHEKFTDSLNEFFKEILKLEPGARMIPWSSKHVNLVKGKSSLPPEQNTYKKYMHFRMKYASQGKKYVRLNIAYPSKGDIYWVLGQIEELSDWWEDEHNYANVSPCQGIIPVIIGWLSRSIETMTQADDLAIIIRQLVDDPSLGLVWQGINKTGQSRVALDGTVRDSQPKKSKNGRKVYEKIVKAAHIEVDESTVKSTCKKLVALYNRNPDKSYPLGYSLYFVQDLAFRAMSTTEGRQGYLKAWAHQKNLMSLLYNTCCNIINIDSIVPASIGVGAVTFRKFLTDLKVTATPGVEGDNLYVAITRTSPEGMEYCFTYHALAITEAEEVTMNLPLVYEAEFGGNQSDYFDYDLRQELTGYTWNVNLRQASSPDGADIFLYGSEMGQDKEENELTMDNINPLELVSYKRLQGECEETVFGGVDNSAARAAKLKEEAAKKAVAEVQLPSTVEAKEADASSGDANSHMSDLTSAGVSTGTAKTGGTIHTIRSDGTYGTRASRVRREVSKAHKKADKEKKQLAAEKDRQIEALQQQMADMLAAQASSPTTILLNRDGAAGGKVIHSGQKPKWDPLLDAQIKAKEAAKVAQSLLQKAQDMADVREKETLYQEDSPTQSFLTLPALPDISALLTDPRIIFLFPFRAVFAIRSPPGTVAIQSW